MLGREEIGELRQAAGYTWKEVDPSIFGTLVEQALDPEERKRLGAHYTPRAYVERLVVATIIEPLREDWRNVQATAETKRASGDLKGAAAEVQAFHEKLCETRVLDPACGTGNFLYVSLELMKRLEGEVLEALLDLGGQEALRGLGSHSVDPHQFLGLEINPRAAAIAELVLWIGYLQWHFRTKGAAPEEPILRAFRNIRVENAVLTWDGEPFPKIIDGKETYPNARQPEWPPAEFIVGNPPFLGKGVFMRDAFGHAYVEALSEAHHDMNDSADFVMYWWNTSANLLSLKGTVLRRFGLVTTNSITQILSRRVVERHLKGKKAISLSMAIPDHPWTKATPDSAAVRIAMTVGVLGDQNGMLLEIESEKGLDTDEPQILLASKVGKINADLTIGVDVTSAFPLQANEGLASMGPALGGRGFVLTRVQAQHLGSGGQASWLKKLTTGRDITDRHRGRFAIDVRKYEDEQSLRKDLPKIFQHLKETVYPERSINNDPKLRKYWWRFRRSNDIYFGAVEYLKRFIATVETTKHRVFVFVYENELLEHGVIGIGHDDAATIGILSSSTHVCWSLANGGTLEDRPRYNKDVCFDPFPFPDANNIQKQTIRVIAEELDSHRKRVLADHPHLTLTGLYNVLEKLRAGMMPDDLDEDDRKIFDDGLVLVLKELHDGLDIAVADAYGWPADLPDDEILARLVALNKKRSDEEKRGLVRWLRPDYQIPRFAKGVDKQAVTEEGAQVAVELIPTVEQKPSFPAGAVEQTAAVFAALAAADQPIDAKGLAAQFKRTKTTDKKVGDVLASLARLGYVTSNDGKTFSLRRVA
jgi:hypothetical protein